ncbi:fumarylacetoacetate hydrolase family protein [Streptomyces fulvoviolaceus]|uniref:fumarylacetoacetate hydrolase family protein n=1 Tax=Streptomyces fulvoviolaceus TaxID=285535 RepID=UPI0004CC5699|nr:fumarylacetoacetate hydrolase family protein [Streptomyces fulvoviolaceus]
MRLVSYRKPDDGATSCGVVTDDGRSIVDAAEALGTPLAGLRELLTTGRIAELAGAVTGQAPTCAVADVQLLPPIPDPRKILCVGLNYRTHLVETGRPEPQYPTLFSRYADTQIGHRACVRIPAESTSLDYEGELAVVIGAPAHRVSVADAAAVVAGYSVYNDFSVRDWQRHTSQFLPGKNFPATGAFGPWLVTVDDADRIGDWVLTTRVNGEVRQTAPIDDLLFDIPHLIAYISTFTALAPGDVIVTGTPGGVGLFRDPPEFLRPDDVVEVDITGIGTLTNVVAGT